MKVNPLVLFIWLALIVFLSLIIVNLFSLIVLVVSTVLPIIFCRKREYFTYMKYSLLSVILIFFFNMILLGPSKLEFTISMVLRLLSISSAFSIFSALTEFEDIIRVMETFRIPPKTVFSFGISLRFFPVVVGDARAIHEVMIAKGAPLNGKKFKDKILSRLPVLESMINLSLDRAINIAEALEIHGFPSEKRRRWRKIELNGFSAFAFYLLISDFFLAVVYFIYPSDLVRWLVLAIPYSVVGAWYGD